MVKATDTHDAYYSIYLRASDGPVSFLTRYKHEQNFFL